jgi:hypothetical protein
MTFVRNLVFGSAALVLALAGALAFESVYKVSTRPRPPDPLTSRNTSAAAGQPLPLRLVDSGGVGIPLEGWGRDYSHDRRSFREVILAGAPYVDAAAFERVDREWRAYVARMLDYGNNAIAAPLFLELIDFDRAGVYEQGSAFRARHEAVRGRFGPLFDWTSRQGMQVFLETDMLALTPPLWKRLREAAPDRRSPGIDASNPAVWRIYAAGIGELFDREPAIQGLVVRFGEGGSLYSSGDWPYRSEVALRNAADVQAMLRALLPVFEARHKTLVLRSWTVGVGRIGRLHVDPNVYDAVLGDIDSPALIVSTKFTAGDFFSYLPLNPTLAGGRHRRLIELQAKPEFEGFNAFPDFLGDEHARAVRALRAANPRIDGTYLFTQFGGPLRAGPRTLYPLHGFWLWTDANVFVASRIAADPGANVRALVRQWAERRFGPDPDIVDAVAAALYETRGAVLEGFYIRPFAEREIRVPGLDLPPLMWIFEWDMVGGWNSLLSLVYQGTRDSVDRAIDEGRAAAATVRRARERLQAAVAAADRGSCAAACGDALRSLEYQETLFEALAAWRQAFLGYYRWLDTGDARAWTAWREGARWFDTAARAHRDRFGGDPVFPAFDLTSAQNAVALAERARWGRAASSIASIAMLVLLLIGRPFARRRAVADVGTTAALTTCVLVPSGVLVAILTGFTTARATVAPIVLLGIVVLTFESTRGAGRRAGGSLLAACFGPLIAGFMVLFAVVAYLGPLGVWYSFWTSSLLRVVWLTTILAMGLWTAFAMISVRLIDGWRAAAGSAIAAVGAGLLALSALLPDWVRVLRALDRPLNVAPATDTMIFALRNYAGVNLDPGARMWLTGGCLLAVGYVIVAIAAAHRSQPR